MIRCIVTGLVAASLALGSPAWKGTAREGVAADDCVGLSAPTHRRIEIPPARAILETSVTLSKRCVVPGQHVVTYAWSHDQVDRTVCLDASPGSVTLTARAQVRYPVLAVKTVQDLPGQC